ncbi:aspartate aminotransferase-like enzyme [Pullulanibacillus pueri]|uniref:Aminotransferase n=1 Tax=Pullulanibacillus pueri TaxID=1437324 RepID=A0A8J3ELW2_9BACL|nr:alanine--glyoxylate aminotransferase family protein [Pullulanibacillus pueri]MBM7682341.1 aspartate aminotransferase-like enzyme [Pullulanibacillus pueri]GGH80734.1 aminotransferase [Pullulanibacillus pueri]
MIINRSQILRTPGPTPIPEQVQKAMSQPMIGHRGKGFSELFQSVTPRLKPIFGTSQEIFLLTGSGTSALEAAVVNTVAPGDEVVVVVTGNFGARFADICEAYQIVVHRLEVEWGRACHPDALKTFLKSKKNIKAVFVTHCETSTGVLNPIGDLASVIHENSDALVIVDTVSSAGGTPVNMDKDGLDVVVSGSQKAFMLPPGLAFITLSENAWKAVERTPSKGFYLNLEAYKTNAEKGMTPYTPALSLIYGLDEALRMMEEEGLDNVFRRHETLMKMTRAASQALGLSLLTTDEEASPTVTAIQGTATLDSEAVRQTALKTFNLVLAGGQKRLKGKIFRIGHMGAITPAELLQTLILLEFSLFKMGYPVSFGTAAKAAEEVLKNEL